MDYRRLGNSPLEVSTISLGCMSLDPQSPETQTILEKAIEAGLNFFDTADIYNDGANETMLGKLLRGKRKGLLIASKTGNVRRKDGGLDWNASKAHILASIDGTLQRLQTDYLDLYQLHGGMITDPVDEVIEAFEILQKQGKIRYYGISSIRPNVVREYAKRSSIVSTMQQYSLLDRRPEEEWLPLLEQKGIGVLVRGAVAQGLLAGKPAKPYLGRSLQEVETAASAVAAISGPARSAAQSAIAFVLGNPAMTSVVLGMRTLEQLKEALGITAAPALTESERQQVSASAPATYYTDHR